MTSESRRNELAKIHIGAKQLGLDEETYRDMLETVAGKLSAAELDERGRREVLAHLRERGAKFQRKTTRRRPSPADGNRPLIGKIYALLGDRPVEYAEAILKRMTSHSHKVPLAWATPEQLRKVVAALSYDQRRRRAEG